MSVPLASPEAAKVVMGTKDMPLAAVYVARSYLLLLRRFESMQAQLRTFTTAPIMSHEAEALDKEIGHGD